MKNKLMSMALIGGLLATVNVMANGLGEDVSWKFKSPNEKFYQLELEKQRLFEEAGGYSQVYDVTNYNDIENQTNNSNYINSNVITIDGDGNEVKVKQDADNSDQDNTQKAVNIEGTWYIQQPSGDFILCGSFCAKLEEGQQ